MSSRECNYCLYQNILSKARQNGDTITKEPKPLPIRGAENGVDIFRNGKWVCWFMELSDHCAC